MNSFFFWQRVSFILTKRKGCSKRVSFILTKRLYYILTWKKMILLLEEIFLINWSSTVITSVWQATINTLRFLWFAWRKQFLFPLVVEVYGFWKNKVFEKWIFYILFQKIEHFKMVPELCTLKSVQYNFYSNIC